MVKKLVAQSAPDGNTSNCGFSGVIPADEEWYVVRIDNVWGASGEYKLGNPGDTVTVSQCHEVGVQIGRAQTAWYNGQNFHYMKKYREVEEVKYDCINGECVVSTQYSTPGQYETLEACQAECGTGNACQAPNICVPPDHCPDGYVCLADWEYTKIQQLLS